MSKETDEARLTLERDRTEWLMCLQAASALLATVMGKPFMVVQYSTKVTSTADGVIQYTGEKPEFIHGKSPTVLADELYRELRKRCVK